MYLYVREKDYRSAYPRNFILQSCICLWIHEHEISKWLSTIRPTARQNDSITNVTCYWRNSRNSRGLVLGGRPMNIPFKRRHTCTRAHAHIHLCGVLVSRNKSYSYLLRKTFNAQRFCLYLIVTDSSKRNLLNFFV